MTGFFAEDFEKAFLLMFGQASHTYSSKSSKHDEAVLHLINNYIKDALFDYCPPRHHRASPEHVRNDVISEPFHTNLYDGSNRLWEVLTNESAVLAKNNPYFNKAFFYI